MKFYPNLTYAEPDPAVWARQREAEGWDGLGVSDHLWLLGRPAPHLWVSLAQMAVATERVELCSSFANNLFRSPVEVAQAALALQRASNGRFEAGIGAGWNRDEMERSGRPMPGNAERAGRYFEAVTIVRELFHAGACRFQGEYYDVDVPMIAPPCERPPVLAVSVGGPRTIREVAPLGDIVEIKASARATRAGGRDGGSDVDVLATVTTDDLRAMVDQVRVANPTAPLGMFALVAVGDTPRVRERAAVLGDNLYGGFVGAAAKVADNLLALADLGISRVQLTEAAPGTLDALAGQLIGQR